MADQGRDRLPQDPDRTADSQFQNNTERSQGLAGSTILGARAPFFVEIRKRADESLVHRYLSGPMTSGTDEPGTLHWWGPDGDQTVHVGTQEERLTNYREGDPLTVEVDETNTISGVHDLQFDLQISQTPPAGSDVQLLLSGTVSKLKSNFVFVRTPVGLVMLNSKIGVPRVKVGQPLRCTSTMNMSPSRPHPLRHQLPTQCLTNPLTDIIYSGPPRAGCSKRPSSKAVSGARSTGSLVHRVGLEQSETMTERTRWPPFSASCQVCLTGLSQAPRLRPSHAHPCPQNASPTPGHARA